MTHTEHRTEVKKLVADLVDFAYSVKATDKVAFELTMKLIADITMHEATRV